VKKTRCLACGFVLAVVLWPAAPSGAAPRCYPNVRFTAAGAGLVNDTLTGLVWQQQASGSTMTRSEAATYCSSAGSGFRLPTIKELDSLVDLTVTSGATINQTAFPSTPAEKFWSSTLYAGGATYAWYVDFAVSGDSNADGVAKSFRVRCVR
jgi:hypothetical protein